MLDGQEEEWERVEGQAAAAAADHQLPVTLYLFGRTGREKEEWFQHFLSASRTGTKCSVSCEENTGRRERHWEEKTDVPPRWIALHGCRLSLFISLPLSEASCGGDAPRESTEGLHDPPTATRARTLLDYSAYMTQLMVSQTSSPARGEGSPTLHKKVKGHLST